MRTRSSRSWRRTSDIGRGRGRPTRFDNDETSDRRRTRFFTTTARLPGAEESAPAAHLAACARATASYVRLQRVLAAVDESAVAVEPPPSFERTVWARLEPNLRRRGAAGASWLLTPAPLGVGRRRGRPGRRRVLRRPGAVAGSGARSDAATRGRRGTDSRAHPPLRPRRASRPLADVPRRAGQRGRREARPATFRASAPRRAAGGRQPALSADGGIDRRRGARRAARRNRAGADGGRGQPESGSSRDLADVRRRIESRDLLFKVRVVSSEIRERQKVSNQRQAGPRS